MLKVGLTGGIGSGKTTIASIFETLGVPVYYADVRAKVLMEQNEDIVEAVKNLFGAEAYENNKLNKSYLASQIFSNPNKRIELNNIVHPLTIADAETWMNSQSTSYCIKEAALIFESHAEKNLDYIIGVYTPVEIRIERIIKRDGVSENEALSKINSQMKEEDKMSRCDFVIQNNEKELLTLQVLKLHENFLKEYVDG